MKITTTNVWLNLPVSDLSRSKKFYEQIGFRPNPRHSGNQELGSFLIGENDFVLMLFQNEVFAKFTANKISDTSQGTEVLINVDAGSREEVDAFADLVREAGGEIYAGPGESEGWMYAFGFCDPDGHRWSVLYMDMSHMPK